MGILVQMVNGLKLLLKFIYDGGGGWGAYTRTIMVNLLDTWIGDAGEWPI